MILLLTAYISISNTNFLIVVLRRTLFK